MSTVRLIVGGDAPAQIGQTVGIPRIQILWWSIRTADFMALPEIDKVSNVNAFPSTLKCVVSYKAIY